MNKQVKLKNFGEHSPFVKGGPEGPSKWAIGPSLDENFNVYTLDKNEGPFAFCKNNGSSRKMEGSMNTDLGS